MYGSLNKIFRSKLALWGIMIFAIILFCITATITFGLNADKKTAVKGPAEKIPSIQPAVSGLSVQNSSGTAAAGTSGTAQLQGQEGNATPAQPAGKAVDANLPELSGGVAASQIQAGPNGANASAGSSSASGALQPVGGLGSAGAGVQAQVNAAGLNLGIQAQLP